MPGPVNLQLGDAASISQNGADAATITLDKRVVATQAVDQYSDGPQNGYFVAVHVTVTGSAGLSSGFDVNPLDFYALQRQHPLRRRRRQRLRRASTALPS